MILHGLPDSYMALDQFIARVHRLTSTKPVNVYIIIPKDSLAEKKWQLIKDKGGASDLAFDGELIEQDEKPVNWDQVLKEMRQAGIREADDAVPEAEVEKAWRSMHFEAPKVNRSQEKQTTEEVAPKHPERAVPCPSCGAKAGSPCKRPSGHTIPYGDVHSARKAALSAFANGRKEEKPTAERKDYVPPTKLPAQQAREEAWLQQDGKKKRKKASRLKDAEVQDVLFDVKEYVQVALF